MPTRKILLLVSAMLVRSATLAGPALSDSATGDRLYRIVDGKVDARTYNGFRRFNASCNHCHGPDGIGSTFGPSLIDREVDVDAFRDTVRNGKRDGGSVMKGFAADPNIAPYVDDIIAYLQARADGALGRGRPSRQGE